MKHFALVFALAAVTPFVAHADPVASASGPVDTAGQPVAVEKPQQASIPFANRGGVRNWQADGRDAIYVQDQHRQWYHGRFNAPCNDLPFADGIAFDMRGSDQLDRYATVLIRGDRCSLNSLVRSDPPASKKATKKTRVSDKADKALRAKASKPGREPAAPLS